MVENTLRRIHLLPLGWKFIKFCIVGGSGYLLLEGLTILFTEVFHLHYAVSMAASAVPVAVWNFALNLKWTFKN